MVNIASIEKLEIGNSSLSCVKLISRLNFVVYLPTHHPSGYLLLHPPLDLISNSK